MFILINNAAARLATVILVDDPDTMLRIAVLSILAISPPCSDRSPYKNPESSAVNKMPKIAVSPAFAGVNPTIYRVITVEVVALNDND